MSEITIRPAEKEDYETVLVLFGKFINKEGEYLNKDEDSFHKVLEDPNSYLDLATVDNQIVGFITYSVRNVIRYPKPVCEVEEFFVLDEHRRLKIGTKLMEHVIKFTEDNNCRILYLASDKKRTDAHKFYKSMDFEEYGYHYRRKIKNEES